MDAQDPRYQNQSSYRGEANRNAGGRGAADYDYADGYGSGGYGQPRGYAQDSRQQPSRQRSDQQYAPSRGGQASYRSQGRGRDLYHASDYDYRHDFNAPEDARYDSHDAYQDRDAYRGSGGYRDDDYYYEDDSYRGYDGRGGRGTQGRYRERDTYREDAYYEDDYRDEREYYREQGANRQRRQQSAGRANSRSGQAPRRSGGSGAGRSRNAYADEGLTFGERVSDLLAGNVWVGRGLVVLALLLLVFVLVNVVSCIGGALSGGQAEAPVEAATSEATSEGTAQGDASGSSSASASQQGVESPWTDTGYFTSGDAKLDTYIKELCDQHSTEGSSFDQNAFETNTFISRTDYVERENNQSPFGVGWDVEYARQYFEEGNSGNCYNFCAVTQFILRYFGYSDAEAQPCVVGLESGNWGDHGLVFVTNKVDGKRCLVDDALSADGWMLDIDAYEYDVRNINQNPTVQGNVDVLDDADEPMRIQPGNLTE